MSIKKNFLLVAFSCFYLFAAAQNDKVYEYVPEFPRFPGCEDQYSELIEKKKCSDELMRTFLAKNAGYPESARLNGEEGTVYIRFIVEPNGSLSTIELIRDMTNSETLVEASLNALRAMNEQGIKWIPGKNEKGEKVRVRMIVPIAYHLTSSKKKKRTKRK